MARGGVYEVKAKRSEMETEQSGCLEQLPFRIICLFSCGACAFPINFLLNFITWRKCNNREGENELMAYRWSCAAVMLWGKMNWATSSLAGQFVSAIGGRGADMDSYEDRLRND